MCGARDERATWQKQTKERVWWNPLGRLAWLPGAALECRRTKTARRVCPLSPDVSIPMIAKRARAEKKQLLSFIAWDDSTDGPA
jgi:hypothetical protein